jgi:hypothetical protein
LKFIANAVIQTAHKAQILARENHYRSIIFFS